MSESNKLINNGYLRAPRIINSGGGGSRNSANFAETTMDDGSAATAGLPLLSAEATTAVTPLMTDFTTNFDGSRAQTAHQATNHGPHTKLPTVVYLGTEDTGGGGGGVGVGGCGGVGVVGFGNETTKTTLQRNAPSPYNATTMASVSNTTSTRHRQCEWLLKDPALRKRLLALAIAFIVLGAAVGALAIYFAGSYRCHPTAAASTSSYNYAGPSFHTADSNLSNLCLTEQCVTTAASLLAGMNTTVDPCENFFQYACGTWNKIHIIPEDKSSITTFDVLSDQQQVIVKALLEERISAGENQATIKAKLFYKSCMDIPQIRKVGDSRLKEIIRSLGGWPVIERNWQPPNMTIETLIGHLRANFNDQALLDVGVGADDKNSSLHVLIIDQMALALPSRDYYLKESSENDIKAYHRYMTQTAILLGADRKTAASELEKVVQFEVLLANVSLPETDRHDISAMYKKITLPELQRQVPELNWTVLLQTSLGPEIPLEPQEEIVSYAMPYLVDMGKILKQTDQRVVHNYIMWRLVLSLTTYMIDDHERERVEYQRTIMGIQSERMRWSKCVDWTNKKLPLAVGALFIRDNFNQESKDAALEMIHNIREAFNELLAENEWMDDETRAVAKEKADAMNERIGYPDILTDPAELEKEYDNLTIVPDNLMENVLTHLRWELEKSRKLLRTPVDKEKWTAEPAVVNAFYNPNKNDIVFPAGILQPLFYSHNFPKSLNYGGIGVVIGHEITHGFDDRGRQHDKDGNLVEWWNNATIEAFRERAQCIIDQYSRFKVDEVGMYMNGRMTQSENIADNGGLKQAFRAYKKWVKRNGVEQDLPGLQLTHDQLFFLNYAQIWCGSMRPEDALTKIRASVHSPGFTRVLGPLANSIDFAKAYKCPAGSPMNPVSKCSVW